MQEKRFTLCISKITKFSEVSPKKFQHPQFAKINFTYPTFNILYTLNKNILPFRYFNTYAMKSLKRVSYICLLCLLVWSCTKKIDYRGEEEDKLVIFSILENNKPIRVHLGRSAAMQHSPNHLSQLKPLLYTDSGDTLALYHDSAGWYSSFVQAHIGESYHIEVAYNDKLYNAHTQVPQKPNVLYATIQYSGHDAPNDSGPICILKTSLVDNPNTTDYYVCEISDETSPAYWYTYQMNEPVILNMATL